MKWNRRLEQKTEKKCTKMVGAHSRPHLSEDERVTDGCLWFWSIQKPIKFWEWWKRFQRQFPNRRTPCRQIIMDKYNRYVQYGLSLNGNVCKIVDTPVRKLPWNLLIVSRTLPIYIYLKNINTRSSTENCGVGCAPAIFLQFFCFLFHSCAPVLGFTYRKALWSSFRIFDYVTSVIILFVQMITCEK